MAQKMANGVFQYKNAKIDNLYPACTIAAQYVVQNMPECKKVRYIGMEPMGEELRSNGMKYSDAVLQLAEEFHKSVSNIERRVAKNGKSGGLSSLQ